MTYRQLCENNQYLYGQLEQGIAEINAMVVSEHHSQKEMLLRLTDKIKPRIEYNLTRIQEYWDTYHTKDHEWLMENGIMIPYGYSPYKFTEKEKGIVNVLNNNPGASHKYIAYLACVNVETVARVASVLQKAQRCCPSTGSG